ncbi:uncharacterized protein [Palaemon carinicauda]|uniref:uncharacterized protein n=1 Tax=Palaemon carinicauda TaxID=392227 RepID=UPI0035B57AF0
MKVMDYYLCREGFEEKIILDTLKDKYIIGRSPICDLNFSSPHISRQHCEITRLKPHGTLIIKNLRPSNVTYVENFELRQPTDCLELRCGAVIGLGVPLNESRTNKNYVFLRVCQNQVVTSSSDQIQEQSVNAIPFQKTDESQILKVPSPCNTNQEASSSFHNEAKNTRNRSYQKEISSLCIAETSNDSKQDLDIIVLEKPSTCVHPNSTTLQRQNALDHRVLELPGQPNILTLDKTNSFHCDQGEKAKSAEGKTSGVKERRLSRDSNLSKGYQKATVQMSISKQDQQERPDQMQNKFQAEQLPDQIQNSSLAEQSKSLKSNNIALPLEHTKLVNHDDIHSLSTGHPSYLSTGTVLEYGGKVLSEMPEVDDLPNFKLNTIKTPRESLGFTPILNLTDGGFSKLQKGECEKPRLLKLSLSNSKNHSEIVYYDKEEIKEDKPRLREQKSMQLSGSKSTKEPDCKTPTFITNEEDISVHDVHNAVSPMSIDLTQPDPDEKVLNSVEDNSDHSNDSKEQLFTDLTTRDKDKDVKRKRSNIDIDESEEKEDGKRQRSSKSSIEKNYEKLQRSEQENCPQDSASDCKSIGATKQVKGQIVHESPLCNIDIGQNLELDQDMSKKHKFSVVARKEKSDRIESKLKRKSDYSEVLRVQESLAIGISDSDEDSQLSPIIQTFKRKHRCIISDDESDHEEDHTSGLKLIEENLMGKKCVIPMSRVSPNIVEAAGKGKAILIGENDELRLASPKAETGIKLGSDKGSFYQFDEDDELPDLDFPETFKSSHMSNPTPHEKKTKKTNSQIQDKTNIEDSPENDSRVLNILEKDSGKLRDRRKGKYCENPCTFDSSSKGKIDGKGKVATSVSTAKKPAKSIGNHEDNMKFVVGLSNSINRSKDVPHQNVVNKKDEDDISIRIKKEKEEDCKAEKAHEQITPVVIKKEPVDKASSSKVMVKNGDSDDDDDIVFMYSQIDETIWVSSDEEETPSQENASFGPLPPSPDLGIASLFDEDSSDSCSEVTKKVEPDLPSIAHEDDDDDDQWFPILSQSFWDDDDLMKPSGKETPKEAKSQDIDPRPSTSGINVTPSFNTNISSWWPELSQGFDDDDDNGETSAPLEVPKVKCTEKSLDGLIEKSKNRGPRKTMLIEPKIPLPRTSNDSLRKRSRSGSGTYEGAVKDSHVHTSSKEKMPIAGREARDKCSKSSPGPSKFKKRKKGPSLRDNLSSKFNLDSYKALAKQPLKDKQTPPKYSKDSKTKVPNESKKSHLISDKPRSNENISVQKKTPHQENNEQSRPKVAAKITRKTRSEKLTEVNLFPSPQLPATRSKKIYTIPKKSTVPASETDKSGKPIKSSLEKDSNNSKIGKVSSKSCNPPDSSHSPLIEPVTHLPSRYSSNLSSLSSHKVNETQQSSESHNMSSDQKSDENVGSALDQAKELVSKCDEDKENKAGPETVKSILKLPGCKKITQKFVRFPTGSQELNKVKYISPRKNKETIGLLMPRMKEVLPKELIFNRHDIPLNFPDHFIVHICMWNYDWLETYRKVQEKMEKSEKSSVMKPPPVVKSINYPTLILYESFRDYKEIFSDLLYLEVWENIYRDWQRYRHNNISIPVYVDKVEEILIQKKNEAAIRSWQIKIITLLSQDQSNRGCHPAQGSLISLKVSRDSERKKNQHLFGYVQDMSKQKRRMMPKELEKSFSHSDVALILEIRIAKEPGSELRCGSVLSLCNISYIRPFTRTWEGLCKLPLSPLCSEILSPKQESLMHSHSAKYLVHEMPLNESQTEAVIQVSAKCIYDPHIPKLSLIHGPPGTGKTRTIVSLVAQIVRLSEEERMPNCRILLCAPSNAVADELTSRLVKLRDIKMPLRVVRVGIRESMTAEVRSYSLDAFIAKHMNRELRTPKNLSARKEWDRKKSMVSGAMQDLSKAKKEKKPKEVIRAMEKRRDDLMRALSEMEKSFAVNLSPKEYQAMQKKCQKDYLLGAQVITTTLGGCFSGPMAEVFSGIDHPFTCCIVDEAGQCKETEMWLPLLYSMRKLVLVGDHKQLPATVLSQLAQDKNLKQSLFERLYHRFVVELQKDELVHILDTQYRMHPEIARWPSEHFYFSKIKTNPDIVQERSYTCIPYAVFDVKNSQEQRSSRNELFNPTECQVVRLILDSIESQVAKMKIGVITPYQCQKSHLEKELTGFSNRLNININTIDGFQGQERDVIILSFVRANSTSQIGFLSERQRLNVALTRARKSCFVVASLSSLSQNKDWQSLIADARSRKLVFDIHDGQMNEGYFKSVLRN